MAERLTLILGLYCRLLWRCPAPRLERHYRVDRVTEQQRSFLAMSFGGPSNYKGRDLRSAHAAPRARGLGEEQYEVFLGHLRDTLVELGVPEPQVAEVMAIADTGKDDVLGR